MYISSLWVKDNSLPITIAWYDDEETILLETFNGVWDLHDYMQLVDEAALLLKQKDHIVHVIADFTATKLVPHQVLTGARYAERKLPANQGVVVFVQPGGIIGTFIKITKQMGFKATTQLYIAETVDSALEIIRANSASLRTQAPS